MILAWFIHCIEEGDCAWKYFGKGFRALSSKFPLLHCQALSPKKQPEVTWENLAVPRTSTTQVSTRCNSSSSTTSRALSTTATLSRWVSRFFVPGFWDSLILRSWILSSRILESQILSFPDFKIPGFWVSRILTFLDFELPRFWLSRILSSQILSFTDFEFPGFPAFTKWVYRPKKSCFSVWPVLAQSTKSPKQTCFRLIWPSAAKQPSPAPPRRFELEMYGGSSGRGWESRKRRRREKEEPVTELLGHFQVVKGSPWQNLFYFVIIWSSDKWIINQRRKSEAASLRYRGGVWGMGKMTLPPRGMDQSGLNFQDIIRTYGRIHIYKISLLGKEIKSFC